MKLRADVSPEKLRGGFYTPAPLVARCLDRAAALLGPDARDLRVLEPSAGDGAFLRALARADWRPRIADVVAVEPLEAEAAKARRALADGGLPGAVVVDSAIVWTGQPGPDGFDLAVGNPPYVRYQFVDARDRAATDALARRIGVPLHGVSNLWIPVLLAALGRLREGGAFAFVVPAECLTGVSAAAVRFRLRAACADVALDVVAPGAFPGVLQEVVVLSGRRHAGGSPRVRVAGVVHAPADDGPWTRHLLAPHRLEAFDAQTALRPLGEVAAFEVSVVTGANDFFCASDATVETHALRPWARAMVPRIRHAPGLRFTAADHDAARAAGARTWMLDFGPDAPAAHAAARDYLAAGERRDLHRRFKCRIRTPWYRVPGIRAGELLLSKRSHLHPRVVVNDARALTTDTIYRGRMRDGAPCGPAALAAGFHNTLTLLCAELEGRSFGGGVLELVPSEIARLRVPVAERLADALPGLDAIARRGEPSALVVATDALLCREGLLDPAALGDLREARDALLRRRLERAAAPRAAAA